MAVASRCTMMSGGKPPEYWGLTFIAEQANSTISMQKNGSAPEVSLMTSRNGKKWEPFIVGTTTITLKKPGDRVFFCAGTGGNSTFATAWNVYNGFVMSGRIAAIGDISSILSQEGTVDSLGSSYAFCSLFKDCSSLTSAPALPATTLTDQCYYYMFYGCTSLTTASALPAETLAAACYLGMFYSCTSLTTAPALPAETLASNCYRSMFYGCTSLTTAPSLPATTLVNDCYAYMFDGCASLTTAPSLPAETLVNNCYYYMFYGCTSLTAAPALPAETLAYQCYYRMFCGCTSFTTAPALPAETLAGSCYSFMFAGCTSLTAAPALPATTLADFCYYSMFSGCVSLSAAPELPATEVYASCYRSMFQGCTSLTTAPTLPAMTLRSYCYQYMFAGCSSLTAAPALPALIGTYYLNNSQFNCDFCYESMFEGCTSLKVAPELPSPAISPYSYHRMFAGCTSLVSAPMIGVKALPVSSSSDGHMREMFLGCSKLSYISIDSAMLGYDVTTKDWVKGVASSGTFVCASSLGDNSSIRRGVDYCPAGWTVQNTRPAPLTFTAEQAGSTVAFVKTGSPTPTSLYFLYSTDGTTWSGASAETVKTLENVGDKLMVCSRFNTTSFAKSSSKYWSFSITGKVAASGSIDSLIPSGFLGSYAFAYLFNNCTSLTSAPGLPATTLSDYCYYSTFRGCSSLTAAPALPATTLADYCYFYMFHSCTSLTTAPALLAETLAISCCYGMFYGCTALTTAPALPATTLASSCYDQMFSGCTSLTAAPALPATTLADSCYERMFNGCSSLTTAPALPATTLADSCYYRMFIRCSSLTTAPALPAETLAISCYYLMFSGCTSLTTAPALPATTLVSQCYRQMFSGCTSLTTAPALPATTLASNCYRQMFNGCNGITAAPDLPAATAGAMTYVYYRMFYNCKGLERTGRIAIETATGLNALTGMFYGCSNLKYIELSGMTTWQTMSTWVSGVSASGLFVCPAALGTESTITRGTAQCPTGWTVANPVAYIAGNSQQSAYIESPYIPQTNDIVTAKLYRNQDSFSWFFNTEDHWYGNTSAIGEGTSFGLGWSNKRMNFGRGWKGSSAGWISGINDIRIEGQKLYVNNTQSTSMAGASLSGTSWMALLGNHRGSSVIECALPEYGIKSFSVTRNGAVIYNFESVKVDNGTPVGCMLDKANLTGGTNNDGLYYNAGTGSFTLGPDV